MEKLITFVLQRGRATGGAEFKSAYSASMACQSLQRGRATGGAEFEVLAIARSGFQSLQRGRATGGAEFRPRVWRWHERTQASTGPRHGGRGISVILPATHAALRLLQRGRATGGAEFEARKGNHERTGRLQRGRATGGAELHRIAALSRLDIAASTGPRHGGRGIVAEDFDAEVGAIGFNGAAPRGARNWTFCKHLGLRMQSRWLRAVSLFPNVRVRRNGASGGSCLSSARERPRDVASAHCRSRSIGMSKNWGD